MKNQILRLLFVEKQQTLFLNQKYSVSVPFGNYRITKVSYLCLACLCRQSWGLVKQERLYSSDLQEHVYCMVCPL